MGISSEQALDRFRSDDLVGIGMEADAVRRRLHPEGVVSYIVERSVDCAAVRDSGASSAFLDGLYDELRAAADMGARGVHLGGQLHGFNGGRTAGIELMAEWVDLLCGIRQRFPAIWIEGLSAPEVAALAEGCGLGLPDTIARLRDAGLDSIAGYGKGMDLRQWIEVHRAAHEVGMRTTAAIVFAAGEAPEQRVNRLQGVRRLQEETGGFAAFVPLAAEAPGDRELDGVTAVERLKTLAISRLFLDNIENVQATRAGQGLKVLQTGLRFGANDAGPVDAGAANGSSEEDLRRVIRDAGFRPVERDARYWTMFLS